MLRVLGEQLYLSRSARIRDPSSTLDESGSTGQDDLHGMVARHGRDAEAKPRIGALRCIQSEMQANLPWQFQVLFSFSPCLRPGLFCRGDNSNGGWVNQLPDTRYSKSVLAVLV
jgi:hypothetical protein